MRLTLTADGDRLRAVVYRADTGQWLTPDGAWSDTPEPPSRRTDGAITGGGHVGLGRGRRGPGRSTFDDFEASRPTWPAGRR